MWRSGGAPSRSRDAGTWAFWWPAGAGPAGLALALQVNDHGADVRVIERRHEADRPSRALIVHSRTLVGVHDDTHGVRAVLRSGGSRTEALFGFVAGCDRAASTVRSQAQHRVARAPLRRGCAAC
jgi:2-polyprenyl-6-methoxyphenol hydroxylase-like FAD-dependent oxidoreductase